jgi:hypothetical protein
MEITVPISGDLALKMSDLAYSGNKFPTARLQKGFLLLKQDQDLAEEGVGFGVPVLKRGIQTIFPGKVELAARHNGSTTQVTARFKMNLVEKLTRPGLRSVESPPLYAVKNFLAAIIRRIPASRGLLTTASNALRWLLKWDTTFEETGFFSEVSLIYTIGVAPGIIHVEVDTTALSTEGITEVVVMNEQGARHFDLYRDARGVLLCGEEIGCWDEVTAEWGSFASQTQGVAFTLWQVNGVRLFRGRELVGARLAWSGFGYSFPPSLRRIGYGLKIERLL